MMIGRHSEDPEGLPPESALVLLVGVRREVRAHLPLEAGVGDIVSRDRHGAAIDLYHEAAARAVRKLKAERKIGNEADVVRAPVMREADSQREGLAHATCLLRERSDEFVGMDELDTGAIPHSTLKRDLKVDDLQLVFDERTAGFAVLPALFDVRELCAVTFEE